MEPRCGLHPDQLAVEVCARCGAFLCGGCLVLADEASCAPCALRARRALRRTRVRWTVGLVVGLALAAAGLWLLGGWPG
jgi:hypothetical protein